MPSQLWLPKRRLTRRCAEELVRLALQERSEILRETRVCLARTRRAFGAGEDTTLQELDACFLR